MIIGIPRALLYYQYYPMWKTFFEELGAEVVVSPPTTQAMLSSGSSRVVADTCLPVKIFLGHVISLAERCDYIFIPAIRSVKRKAYNCSKFLGLPDMTKAVIPESPPILDIEIDVNNGSKFKGFEASKEKYHTSSFECKACPNLCEIAQISINGQVLARWGGRCDLWERSPSN